MSRARENDGHFMMVNPTRVQTDKAQLGDEESNKVREKKQYVGIATEVPPELQINSFLILGIKYTMMGLALIGVFVGSFITYSNSYTTVLTDSGSLSQCSTSSEINAFAPFNQSQMLQFYYTDSSNTYGTFMVSLFAKIEVQGISTTSATHFTPSSASCGESVPASDLQNYNNYTFTVDLMSNFDSQISTDSAVCTQASTAIYNNQYAGIPVTTLKKPQVAFTCGAALNSTPAGYSKVFPLNSVVDCNTANEVIIVGSLVKTNTTITGSCQASICGSSVVYYQESRSLQPSGVYTCDVPASPFVSMSNAFANAHVAERGTQMIITAVLGTCFLGFHGFIQYILSGGKI